MNLIPIQNTTDKRVLALLKASMSANTMRVYTTRLKTLSAYLKAQGIDRLLDIKPSHLTLFFATVGCKHSDSWRVQLVAAVNAVFDSVKVISPARDIDVRNVLKGLRRTDTRQRKQAKPLREVHMEKIERFAGALEKALIFTMQDALLRVSEASALLWPDISFREDDTGRLTIRKSKTDQEGKGAVCYLRKRTVTALRTYGVGFDGKVFPHCPETLTRKIAETCKRVGIGEGYTGHSCRVGMTCDLVERGASLLAVQVAGRWKSSDMPAYYAKGALAGKNAVATYMEN